MQGFIYFRATLAQSLPLSTYGGLELLDVQQLSLAYLCSRSHTVGIALGNYGQHSNVFSNFSSIGGLL